MSNNKKAALEQALRLVNARPAAEIPEDYFTAREFAERSGLTNSGALHRLQDLFEKGLVVRIRNVTTREWHYGLKK